MHEPCCCDDRGIRAVAVSLSTSIVADLWHALTYMWSDPKPGNTACKCLGNKTSAPSSDTSQHIYRYGVTGDKCLSDIEGYIHSYAERE